MKKNRIIYSTVTLITLLTFSGCGSDSSTKSSLNDDTTTEESEITEVSETTQINEERDDTLLKSGYPVVVERGAVLDANVTDANGSVAIQVSDTNNTYIFDEEPEFPIMAEGGWIDVDGDGNLTEEDIELDVNLTSYSDNITPTTTYLSDDNETVRQELEEELAEETNSTIEELTELPSKATKNSIMVLNAVYEKLIERKNERSNAPLAIRAILDRYEEINATVEVDANASSQEMAQAIEAQTIFNLDEKGLIERVTQEDIKRIKDKKPPKIKDRDNQESNATRTPIEEEEVESQENNETTPPEVKDNDEDENEEAIESESEEEAIESEEEENSNNNGKKPPKVKDNDEDAEEETIESEDNDNANS